MFKFIVTVVFSTFFMCRESDPIKGRGLTPAPDAVTQVLPAAARPGDYVPRLKGKNVALVVNQTSMVGDRHLLDTLLNLGVEVRTIFAPEHGIRGKASAGETISDSKDAKTGLPVISLYGKKKKPSATDIQGIDVVVFDIQDVGVRFYTYISTLHYVMEACAENNIGLLVLDRPNPNGHYIDGPVLDTAFRSFVGMHPVPVVCGMTIGEYARMINGEGWLAAKKKCMLDVMPCKNYSHDSYYELPVRPSPNLKDMRAILLYPSTCWFEGTTLSLGRGTEKPFQYIGHPDLSSDFSFTPSPNEGAKDPPLKDKKCYGADLSKLMINDIRDRKSIDLSYLLDFYRQMKAVNGNFFLENNFFDKLAGTEILRKQIIAGDTEQKIRRSWAQGLQDFGKVRQKYLLY